MTGCKLLQQSKNTVYYFTHDCEEFAIESEIFFGPIQYLAFVLLVAHSEFGVRVTQAISVHWLEVTTLD